MTRTPRRRALRSDPIAFDLPMEPPSPAKAKRDPIAPPKDFPEFTPKAAPVAVEAPTLLHALEILLGDDPPTALMVWGERILLARAAIAKYKAENK